MGVASVLIASGAWFRDKDKVDSNVTLGHIELNDNFKRFTQFTIPIVLSRQNVLEEDILFTPSVDTGNLYVRFKVSYPIMANTSLRARDVQHYQKITPFTTSDQNHVNFGHKWVQVGEYFYFCDENGVPSILTKNDHKENEEDYYVFLQKDALTISSRMSKNLFAENEELTLQISVEAIQSDNVNSEIDENGQIIDGQDGIVDGIDDIVYAFSEQYPTDKYEWEFISESGSLINNFKDLRYGDKVELPTYSVSSDKTFVEWNTSADGTGAPITNDVIESITESKKVYAIVHQNEVKISVNAGPNGTIKPYSPEINGYMVDYATDQTFEIVPDIGYKISSITVDGSNIEIEAKEGMSQKYTFSNITVEHSISATFEAREFVITYNTLTENSSGEPTFVSSVTNVRYPNQHSIDITPPQGYSISSILVDNIALEKEAFDPTGHTIDFGVVTQDHIVVATFSRIKYTITYHKNGGQEETGKENPTTIYITDEARDLNPVLKANNIFVGWYDNSSFNGSIIKQIPANPNGNLNYYAKFVEQSTLERTANYGYQIFPNFDYDFAGIKVVEENGLLHIKYDATTASGSNISLTPTKTYVRVGNAYVEKTLADFGSISDLRVQITSKNQTNFGTLANSGSTSLQNVPGSSNNDYYYFSAQDFKSLISNKNVTSFDAILETIEAITAAQASTNADVSLIIATNSALPQGLSYSFVWMGPSGTISNQEISSHESIVLGQSTFNNAFYTATQSGEYSCQVSIKDENNNNVITPFKISWTIDINRDIHFTQMSDITKTYDAKPAVPEVSDLPIGATVTYSYTGTLANGSLVSGFGNSFVDAGEYEVTALINGGKYYTNSTSTCTVKINRATLSIPDALKAVTVLPGSTFVNPLTSPTVASEDISGIAFSSNIASVQINQTTGIVTILSDKNIDRQTATITIDGGNNFVGLSYTISQHPFMFSNSTTLSSYVGTESDVVVPETITDVNKIANGKIQATKENAFTPTTIESGAFSNIANLKTLTFPTATTTMKTGAISSCPSLQKIITKTTLSSNYSLSGIRESGSWYRGGVEVSEITIAGIYNNSGIIEGSSAEWEYSNGTITAYLGTSVNIKVPHRIYNIQTGQYDTVTKIQSIIGSRSQIGKSAIKTVIISENITEIGTRAFAEYGNLEKVVLPTTLEVVGDEAFAYSSSINSAINLGACTNLKSIGISAFMYCGNALMGTIDLSGATQLSSLGSLCFGLATNLTEFRLPSNIQTIGQEVNIFGADTNLSKITASGTHTAENNNVLYNSAKTILYAYAPKNSRTTYSIPDSVTTIVGLAFYGASSLEQITLGSKLTSVGLRAFGECPKLMRINVPKDKSSTYATILSGSDDEKGFNDGCLMYENGVPKYGYVASTYKWEPVKTIKLTIDGNGTGQVECNGETYTKNSTIYVIPSLSYTLTLTPNSGSFIKSVFVDSEEIKLSQSNSESFEYTFSNITSADHTFAVTFQTKVFEIYDGTSSFFFDNLQDAVSFAQQKYPSTLVQLSLFVDYTSATPVSFEDVWFDYNSLKTLNVPINLGQNSKLTILGGTFVAQVTQNGGSLIVNGGKLSSLVTNDGTATINDGTIASLTSSADITIQGGNVTTLKLNNSSTATLGTPVVTNAILDADKDYTELEYIEATGTQYIDTEFVTKPTTAVEIDFQYTDIATRQQRLFGHTYDSDTSDNVSFGSYINGAGCFAYAYKDGAGNWITTGIKATTTRTKVLMDGKNKIYSINDGTTYKTSLAGSLTRTSNATMVIFGDHRTSSPSLLSKMKLYSFTLWDNNVIVRDFVPAKRNSDGAIGLLDKVEGKFYENAGTGAFTAGSAKTLNNANYRQIDSLTFSGSQYINTGIIPTANTKVETTFKTSTNAKWLFGSRTSASATNIYGFYFISNTSVWYQIKTNSSTTQKPVSAYFNKKSSLSTSRSEFTFNGQTFSGLGTDALGASTLPMYVGALSDNGTADGRYFVGELYSFKIWDGTTLVRDFVPVVRTSDGAAGLLDLVENKFYQSISSQQFVTPSFGSKLNQTQPLSQPINLTVSSPVQGQVVVTGTPTLSNYKLTNENHSLVLEDKEIKIYSAFDVRAYARGSATNSGTYTSIGGVIEPSSVLLKLGEKTTLTAVADQGWRFGGWYTSVDGNGKPNGTKLSASESIEISYADGMASIYYAHFIKTQTIKINFESIVSSPADVTITANDSISISPETISSTGSIEVVFDYSSSKASISATINSSSNKYNLIWDTTPTAEQTTSAVSTTVSASADSTISLTLTQLFTITYDANGGVGTVANQTVAFRQPFTTNNGSSLSRSGYSLSGWNTSSDGNGTNYMPNQNVTTYSDANDITLYAMWKGNASKVTFDPQTMTPNFTGSQTMGGLTITNNGDGTITFDGTLTGSTDSIAIADVYVAQGQNIDVYMTYVSGARSFSGACFVTEISRDGTTSQRPIDRAFLDINNGNSPDSNPGVRTKSGSIPVDSPTRAACEKFFFWMWKSDTGTATFDNYRVKFEVSPAPQKEVYVGETYGELPIPQRAGYKFEGWNGGSKNMATYLTPSDWGGTSSAEDLNNGKHILTTHGDWSTFRLDLPNYVGKKVTISGIIKSITATNSSFSGLYVGQAGSAAYPRHIPNSSDKLLIANSSTQIPENGLYFSKTCTIATGAENYTFIGLTLLQSGWNPNGICELVIENLQIEVSDSATDFESPIKTVTSSTIVTNQHDHDLLATWSPVSYQIAYDSNGGAGRMDNSTHTYGVEKALSTNTFSRDGYEFVGWSTQSDGNGTFYSDGQMVTNLANAQDAIVILYAKWTGATYTISFDSTGTGGTLSKTTYQTNPKQQNITVDADPTKKGYTVESYSTSNEKTYIIGKTLTIPANAYGNIVLIPTWKPKTYTIKYEPNGGGGTMAEDKITYNDHCTISKTCGFTKTGYDFVAWTTQYNGEYEGWTGWSGTWQYDNGEWGISNDTLVLTAKWKLHTYTITIDQNGGTGGTTSHTFTYSESAQAISFSPPTKKGYHISSWSSDYTNASANGSTINIPAKTAQDFTITANWTANEYTINYNANGGTGTMESQSVTFDTTMSIKDCTFTKTGYQFVGWKTKYPDGSLKNDGWTNWSGKWTYDDGQYGISNKTLNLYAEWSANTYIVTLNSLPDTIGTYSVDGSTWTLSNGEYIMTSAGGNGGYLSGFSNYMTNGVKYRISVQAKASKAITLPMNFEAGASKSISLTTSYQTFYVDFTYNSSAQYKALTFYSSSWSSGDKLYIKNAQLAIPVTFDSTYGTLPALTRTGYTFKGWFTTLYSDGTPVTSTTKVTNASNHTIYPQWTAHTYTVVYNGNGATGGSTANSSHTYGVSKTLTANGFTKTGYTFAGWNTQANGTGTTYSNKQSVTNLTSTQGATVTLYAQWTANIHSISFDPDGGSGGTTELWFRVDGNKFYTDSSCTTELPNQKITCPTLTGYIFEYYAEDNGWHVSFESDGSYYAEGQQEDVFQYDNDFSFTASWKAITYTVVYDGNGATSGSTASSTHTYNESKNLTANGFKKTGYLFAGWKKDNKGATYNNAHVVTNLDSTQGAIVTMYAQWSANSYIVTANANGGTIPTTSGWTIASGNATATKTVKYDSTYGTLPTPTRTAGYEFVGWTNSLFSMSDWLNSWNGSTNNGTAYVNKGANTVTLTATTDDCFTNPWNGADYRIKISPSTTYSFSWKQSTQNSAVEHMLFLFNNQTTTEYTNGYFTESYDSATGRYYIKFTSASTTNYVGFRLGIKNATGTTLTFSELKLEEGSTPTAYLTTSTTTVKTPRNHTLYAVWEGVNMYARLINDSSSSTGTTGLVVQYNGSYHPYGNLNDAYIDKPFTSAPKRSGYTFGGYYTGENGTGTQWFDANGNLKISRSTLYSTLLPYTNSGSVSSWYPLYAKWTEVPKTITLKGRTVQYRYKQNDGTWTSWTTLSSTAVTLRLTSANTIEFKAKLAGVRELNSGYTYSSLVIKKAGAKIYSYENTSTSIETKTYSITPTADADYEATVDLNTGPLHA